ncbi:aluminum-activated malate transporter 7-like, partial [Durio zibethinus]|uniref:Aluminum-activated malate transporter 7-like n=1 Tax=Durio zibethinus TaxID=66656 RepID=A0A6P5ZMG9_DURZI
LVLLLQAKPEIRSKIQETYSKMSMESGKALKELALAIKRLAKPFSADIHIENSKSAVKNLNSLVRSGLLDDEMDLLEVVRVATVASLLIDVITYTEEIAGSVLKLASMASFEAAEPTVSPEKPETRQPEIVNSYSNDANST